MPKPLQQPLPVLIAANPKPGHADEAAVDRILRRVAKHADGRQTDATPVETFRQRFRSIREYTQQEGRDPSQMESRLLLMVNINNDWKQAYRKAETFLTSYYGAGIISRGCAEL